MTRVLQVLGRSAGGIAGHVAQVTSALDGTDGFEIDIAGPIDLPVTMTKQPIELLIPDGPVKGHKQAVSALKKIIRSGGYDVIHAHGLRAGIDAALAARGRGAGVLLTVHNLVQSGIAGRARAVLYRRAEAVSVKLTDHTFCVSEDIASHLRRTVRGAADKIEVLHLGVGRAATAGRSPTEVKRSLGLAPGTSLVVTLARLAPQKALDVMLFALAGIDDPVHLVVIGEGPLKAELEGSARRLLIDDRVHLLGWRNDAADFLGAADVFCLSSIWEGVPLAAQEAILAGVPVVATDVGGMRELITDKMSGRLVPSGDPDALGDAITAVLADRELSGSYAKAAREGLDRDFSTAAMLSRLKDAYRDASHV
jgi:glycosyltransferase involved in cell wall biosynthesis